MLLRSDRVFRDRPGSAQSLCAGNSSVQCILIHPAHRDTPALCCFLYGVKTFHDDTSYHGFIISGGILVSRFKHYYIPFFAEDKFKNEKATKRSVERQRETKGRFFCLPGRSRGISSPCHPEPVGVRSARRKSRWLFLSEERAATQGKSPSPILTCDTTAEIPACAASPI